MAGIVFDKARVMAAVDAIAEQTGADVVQVIGSRFVLFKRNVFLRTVPL